MAKIPDHAPDTIADSIGKAFGSLTRAERQLANTIVENYPVSGLGSITQVAKKAGVSSPTIVRMVKKLGFKGFPEFQAELRRELEARISGPITKHDSWAQKAPDSHILNRFADAVIENIRQSLGQIETESFDATCKLLSDTGHRPPTVYRRRANHARAGRLPVPAHAGNSKECHPYPAHIQLLAALFPGYRGG
jgi:DNA-binding MurR/RpiR family transcriptional regulator